jgi:hypothetical protein
MIPPARLFFITRFAWSWRYRWTGASFLFHFLSERLPGRTSHLSLRLFSQDWRTAGAHGRIRTGLCSYIRISATHRFSSTATAYLAGLHNDTALSIYWVCMALAWLHLTDDTFYGGVFVAWRSIVWDILSLPLGHAWVFFGFNSHCASSHTSRHWRSAPPFLSLQGPLQAYVYFPTAQLFSWLWPLLLQRLLPCEGCFPSSTNKSHLSGTMILLYPCRVLC